MRTSITHFALLCLAATSALSAGCSGYSDLRYAPQYGAQKPGQSVTPPQTADPANQIDDVARSLAGQLSNSVKTGAAAPRIAVLPMNSKGNSLYALRLAETLPDALKAELFNMRKFQIVADHDMGRALTQLNTDAELQNLGYISKETIKRVGSLLNADAILHGSITGSVNKQRVLLELINVQTGQIDSVAQSLIDNCTLVDSCTPTTYYEYAPQYYDYGPQYNGGYSY